MSPFPDIKCEVLSGLTTFMFMVCDQLHIICLLLTCAYTMCQYNVHLSFISVSKEVETFCRNICIYIYLTQYEYFSVNFCLLFFHSLLQKTNVLDFHLSIHGVQRV